MITTTKISDMNDTNVDNRDKHMFKSILWTFLAGTRTKKNIVEVVFNRKIIKEINESSQI